MSYVVLARKYRPRSFAEMVGQQHVVQALTNALTQRRLHHAYLFTGTRGVGKTTVSRILAKSLNCTGADGRGGITATPCGVCQACTEIDADRYLDYIELDAASNRSIDEVRDLIERAAYKPGIGRFKVFMIDEAHQLTKDAFNALLKTLEEPPEYLKFVLATTDPEKMLPTVLSRCLQFNLRPMAPATVREHLAHVLALEQVPFDDGALRLLARESRGSMRDGLSLTDQAVAYGGGRLDEAGVRAMLGSVDHGLARTLVEALAARDGVALLAAVQGLRERAQSAAATLEAVALLAQQMAVEQAVPGALDADDPDSDDARACAALLPADETQLLYGIALHGRDELALLSDEYAALTMVLLRFLAFPPAGREPPAATGRAAPLRASAASAIAVRAAVPVNPAAAVRSASEQAVSASSSPQAAALAPPTDAASATLGRAPTVTGPPPPSTAVGVATPPPATAAVATPVTAAPMSVDPPAQAAARVPVGNEAATALAERWDALARRLHARGGLIAMVRELMWQAELIAVDERASPPLWRLRVEREPLRAVALADKLAGLLGTELGTPVAVETAAGVPTDSPARRDAAAAARRQHEAEASIRQDPVVVSLLSQFKTARIVPGSIKPL